jgi:tetratricopeptide (TPR) repeat protein
VRTPDRAASSADAETRPPATDAGTRDTARPPAETGGTAPAADNIARANELVGQGDAALGARNFDAARAAYLEALGLQPANNRAKIGLGRAAFQQGDFEEAVRYLEPIYRNQGNMDLGVAYVRLGRLPDAKAQFEKLVERNPNNQDAVRALEAVNRQLGQ